MRSEFFGSEKRIRITVILFTLLSGIIILGLKFYAANISNSSALRSDALEGTANVLAALLATFSIFYAEIPADSDHPYGHGKIEYFSAAFEGGLISLAGVLILIDATSRMINPEPFLELSRGLKINALAGLLNGFLGVFVYLVAKKTSSEVLKASALHLITDVVTTFVLLIGLLIVSFTGMAWIDPILAILLSLMLMKTGLSLVIRSTNALMDAQDPALLKNLVDLLNQTLQENNFKKVITLHELKAQRFGRNHHIDFHLVVPEYLSIKEAHHLSDQFADSFQQKLATQKLGTHNAIHVHLDPCMKFFCAECSIQDCPIRSIPLQQKLQLTVETATKSGKI